MTNNKLTKDFRFKQFHIWGGSSGMPVSTDGVLLGSWAMLPDSGSLLDIGTGTGLLALMAAQRNPELTITALDIDEHAVQAAIRNSLMSPWADRISIIKEDINRYKTEQTFAGIICNPPYFNSGETAKQHQRALARHTTTLNHQDLLVRAFALTGPEGVANFILPINESTLFVEQAQSSGWFLNRMCHVHPTQNKPVTRCLLSMTKQKTELVEETLLINKNGHYSDEFVSLTKDFYLKM